MNGSSPLHVHDDVTGHVRDEFGQAIGAGEVVAAGEAGDAAEGLDGIDDALIVGGHHHGIHRRERGAAVDVFHHGPAGDFSERFSRKAGRVVAGRDDRDD